MREKILLINPPIYDFASYDFWLKPLGLMYIASFLNTGEKYIEFFDVLDRFHPLAPPSSSDRWGRGKFFYEVVKKAKNIFKHPKKIQKIWITQKTSYRNYFI